MSLDKRRSRARIQNRIRKNLKGTAACPRLTVFKSNKAIYCQIIDDVNGQTLASAKCAEKLPKIDQAKKAGQLIGEAAKQASIEAVVFDRSGYIFHGRIKALADAAREAGLKF